MRSLVISPASAEKRDQVADAATAAELADPQRRRQAEERLSALACPAIAMYTGAHHRLVVEGMRAVWERWGEDVLHLSILSPGYGLLSPATLIVPYEAAFCEPDEGALGGNAAPVFLRDEAAALVGRYDLVFYLLSGPALARLCLPLDVPSSVQQILLTDRENAQRLSDARNLYAVTAAEGTAARRWHVRAAQVTGFLFRRLCDRIVQHGPAVLEWLQQRPQDVETLFYKRARWEPQFPLWPGAEAVGR